MKRVAMGVIVLVQFCLAADYRMNKNSFCGGYMITSTAAGRISASLQFYQRQIVKIASKTTHLALTEMKDSPSNFTLAQNYPNPFNPTTTIEFSLPLQDQVSLKIFNFLGDQVAVLLDEQRAAGNHRVIWNAVHFANGVYFYILQTSHARQVRKALLMK